MACLFGPAVGLFWDVCRMFAGSLGFCLTSSNLLLDVFPVVFDLTVCCWLHASVLLERLKSVLLCASAHGMYLASACKDLQHGDAVTSPQNYLHSRSSNYITKIFKIRIFRPRYHKLALMEAYVSTGRQSVSSPLLICAR